MRTSAAASKAAQLPQKGLAGEFGFDRGDFEFIATTLYEDAGIHLPATKASLVYSRLTKRLRHLGLESFKDYCALVGSSAGAEERTQMIAALTTNVTRFFREPHHFDHVRAKLIVPRADAIRAGARLRIWSAGCSSGQEPYSIALTILSHMPDVRSFDVKILATDINPHVLETARRAIYPAEEVQGVPLDQRRAWMEAAGNGTMKLDDAVRGLVNFKRLNLMGAWPMRGPFDAVFCRNVLIYFDEKTQTRLLNRVTSLLRPGGFLYLGHSERLVGPAEAMFKADGTTSYRKFGGEEQ
jgi:chemotaxis protein methyltransferase CheR